MNRIVIYAHYDHEGIIRDYVQFALKALGEVASKIIFVTTAKLLPEETTKLANLTSQIIAIENIGYDFFSWKTGILAIQDQLADLDQLILVNSSIIGPIFPLNKVFEKMQSSSADFWGLTESYEINYHLQSYFLVFNKNILNSKIFLDYWNQLVPLSERQEVIDNYELKLTAFFVEKGFRVDSFIKISKIKRANIKYWFKKFRTQRNPTLYYPFELLKLKMPFIKIQLIRDNPFNLDLIKYLSKFNHINDLDLDTIFVHYNAKLYSNS